MSTKNYELDINQFEYENELHSFIIEVTNNDYDFKLVSNMGLATKKDYELIQQAVYEFEYTPSVSLKYDEI